MTPKRRLAVSSLLIAGFGVAFVSMLSFAALFFVSTQRLHQITNDLYIHPFAVSNAAASLKSSLYQMRSGALIMVVAQMQGQEWEATSREIVEFERTARRELEVIKQNFLGDMAVVHKLETGMDEWAVIRSHILAEVRQGNFTTANELVVHEGTPKFEQIIEATDYVLNFAKQRAKGFVEEGENEATTLIDRGNMLSVVLIVSFLVMALVVFWRVISLQKQLTLQASTDFLTGIPNRRHFISLVEYQESQARRSGEPFSLAVVDIDFFKKINDTHGHAAGDEVLRRFCQTCRANLRDSDTIGRLGGEEFGILMPNTWAPDALQVIERIREAVAASEIRCEQGPAIRFTASFGLSASKRQAGDLDIAGIFRAADEALYNAKGSGRNRVVVAEV